jgi:glycogen debranching enzyme
VEQGTFTIGFMRYGLHEKVDRLSRALFEAAALFDYYRLPEVFSGHPRDEQHPFPAFYPQSNSPQAWSSSAVFNFIQSILGLYPYAPLHLLFLDPHLPDWLPELVIRHLQIGQDFLDIRFYRKPDGSSDFEVLDRRGFVKIIRQPSPWSLTADFTERFVDFVKSIPP